MRLFVKFVLLVVVGVCSVVLSGCSFIWTTENGDPATPEDIKSSVEKGFRLCIRILFFSHLWWRRRNHSSEMCMCFMMKVMVFPLLQIL